MVAHTADIPLLSTEVSYFLPLLISSQSNAEMEKRLSTELIGVLCDVIYEIVKTQLDEDGPFWDHSNISLVANTMKTLAGDDSTDLRVMTKQYDHSIDLKA